MAEIMNNDMEIGLISSFVQLFIEKHGIQDSGDL